jgi:hypothetical protein
MKAGELTDSTIEMPKANIVIELPNGQSTAVTGFWVRQDRNGKDVIIIKSGRNI